MYVFAKGMLIWYCKHLGQKANIKCFPIRDQCLKTFGMQVGIFWCVCVRGGGGWGICFCRKRVAAFPPLPLPPGYWLPSTNCLQVSYLLVTSNKITARLDAQKRQEGVYIVRNKWPLTALDKVTLYKGSIYREFHPSDLRVATLDRVTLYPGGR